MSIPDGAQAGARDEPAWLAEAVEAAAESIHHTRTLRPWLQTAEHVRDFYRHQAKEALATALLIIREQIAREIEAAADVRLNDDKPDEYGTAFWNGLEDGYDEAAQIGRGAL